MVTCLSRAVSRALSPLLLLGRSCHAWGNHWCELPDDKGWESAVRQMAADRLDLAELIGEDMIYVTPNAEPASSSTAIRECWGWAADVCLNPRS